MTPESSGLASPLLGADSPAEAADEAGAGAPPSPAGAASGGGQATAASTFPGAAGESFAPEGAGDGSTLLSLSAELPGFGSSVDIVVARTPERLVHKSPSGSGKWRAENLTVVLWVRDTFCPQGHFC
jgi:hypothetical protein